MRRNGMLLIDKYILKCCDFLDKSIMWVEGLFAPKCKCKKKKDSKRTYTKEKDHGTDISFENEVNNGK